MPLLFGTVFHNKSERHIFAAEIVKCIFCTVFCSFLPGIFRHQIICKVPILVTESENSSGCNFTDVFIISLNGEVRINDSFIVFLIKFPEVSFCSISRVIVDDFGLIFAFINIYYYTSVVWIAVKIHRSTLDRIISPVLANACIRNNRRAVRHVGIGLAVFI